jgi:hypothetical protein
MKPGTKIQVLSNSEGCPVAQGIVVDINNYADSLPYWNGEAIAVILEGHGNTSEGCWLASPEFVKEI